MTKTKKIVICALFTAIICITAPFSIPVGPVPVTFTLFSLALTAFVVGSKKAVLTTVVYILIGLAGFPVFSNFGCGVGAILSPTGGFVVSYVLVVFILGLCNNPKQKIKTALLWTAALIICYLCGIIWFMFYTSASLTTALIMCVIPFIPFDVIKLIIAYVVAKAIKSRLKI